MKIIERHRNRRSNRQAINDKVFCIGLHKTGTTTLAKVFRHFGYRTIHNAKWQNDEKYLNKYDFFSDGGSHFDNQYEFDFERLFIAFPKAKFILNTRDTRKWIISKLKHAGWRGETEIEPDDESKILHDEWRYKSLLHIQKFIEHKTNYEKKVIDFFEKNDPERLLIIDITDKQNQKAELERLIRFCGLQLSSEFKIVHANKAKTSETLSTEVLQTIDDTLAKNEVRSPA